MRPLGEYDLPERLEDAAATWVFRRGAGLTSAEQAAFERWRAADPRHEAALAHYEQAWSTLDRPRETGQASFVLHKLTERASRRRRRRLAGITASVVVLIAAAIIWRPGPSSAALSDLQATVVLPEKQTLPDGSIVELRSGAEIEVDFSNAARRIVLRSGAAHFSVAHEERPFVVAAGDVEFRAVGTAFGVQLASSEVELLVTEGRVAVGAANEAAGQGSDRTAQPAASPAQRLERAATDSKSLRSAGLEETGRVSLPSGLLVTAGNRVVVGLANQRAALLVPPTVVTTDELAERLAWRAPKLEFTETPLADAVALMNAHNRVQLVVKDAELGRLRVSGLFRADRAAAFVRLLEVNFDVRTEERGHTVYLYRKR